MEDKKFEEPKAYFCKQCFQLKMKQIPRAGKFNKLKLSFCETCQFDLHLNEGWLDKKVIGVNCRTCLSEIASIKWEFYTANFRMSRTLFKENVFVNEEKLLVKKVLPDRSEQTLKTNKILNVIGCGVNWIIYVLEGLRNRYMVTIW